MTCFRVYSHYRHFAIFYKALIIMEKPKITRYNVSGERLQRLVFLYGPHAVAVAVAEYREAERVRVRLAAAKRHTKRRGELGLWPDYPDHVLDFIERWIGAQRRVAGSEVELAEVVFRCRKAARLALVADYERIQDKGMGKALRACGFVLKRSSGGMLVCGLDL